MTTLDLELTKYAAKVADAIVAIEKDLKTDYHVHRVPLYITGEATGHELVANDVGGYDLKVAESEE